MSGHDPVFCRTGDNVHIPQQPEINLTVTVVDVYMARWIDRQISIYL
jgi:hypothetical protein